MKPTVACSSLFLVVSFLVASSGEAQAGGAASRVSAPATSEPHTTAAADKPTAPFCWEYLVMPNAQNEEEKGLIHAEKISSGVEADRLQITTPTQFQPSFSLASCESLIADPCPKTRAVCASVNGVDHVTYANICELRNATLRATSTTGTAHGTWTWGACK